MKQLTPWQKKTNEDWFRNLTTYIRDGGVWVWPDTGYTYIVSDGKLSGESDEADEALREILPDNSSIQYEKS